MSEEEKLANVQHTHRAEVRYNAGNIFIGVGKVSLHDDVDDEHTQTLFSANSHSGRCASSSVKPTEQLTATAIYHHPAFAFEHTLEQAYIEERAAHQTCKSHRRPRFVEK